MEHHPRDLNDPIEKKLDDNRTLERLVRKAVSDAVDKARKLGFLDDQGQPVKQVEANSQY
jgi:DNA-binding protein YbaB